jgi:hypothetical protein
MRLRVRSSLSFCDKEYNFKSNGFDIRVCDDYVYAILNLRQDEIHNHFDWNERDEISP